MSNIQSDTQIARYLQIVASIKQVIIGGQIKPQQKIPSGRKLAEHFGVSRQTVVNALNELIAQGFLISKEKSGYYVSDELPVVIKQNRLAHEDSNSFHWKFNTTNTQNALDDTKTIEFNFVAGTPDFDHFPFAEYRKHLAKVMNYPDKSDFTYDHAQGQPDLIAQISRYLQSARNLKGRPIFITHGSQEAIYMISKLLLNKGDFVAVDEQGYQPAWQAFKDCGAKTAKISHDTQGICTNDLLLKIKNHRIKLIYLTPENQYPTTIMLSSERRKSIYSIAKQYHIPILEDDYDHEYHYQARSVQAMATQDPLQLVIYVSTFSKILYPGARVGFIAATPAVIEQLINLRKTLSHKSESMTHRALALWMQEGGFSRHLLRSTQLYKTRLAHTVKLLKELKHKYPALGICFNIPASGLGLWIKLNIDCRLLAKSALTHNILVHDASYFSDDMNADSRHIRLGFAYHNESSQQAGINKLFIIASDMLST